MKMKPVTIVGNENCNMCMYCVGCAACVPESAGLFLLIGTGSVAIGMR